METLLTTSDLQTWTNMVTVETSKEALNGSWAKMVLEAKALRAYAASKQVPLADVALCDVEKTDLGVKGWADMYASMPSAAPKTGGDGTCARGAGGAGGGRKRKQEPQAFFPDAEQDDHDPAEGKEKPARKVKKDNPVGKKEWEVKELLAQEQECDNTMSTVADEMMKSPAWWAWARALLEDYKKARKVVSDHYTNNDFFKRMKLAALSPKELQKAKKDSGEEYVPNLCAFVTHLGPHILEMHKLASEINGMAQAKRNSSTPPANKARAKGKSKAKARVKRAGSAKSL